MVAFDLAGAAFSQLARFPFSFDFLLVRIFLMSCHYAQPTDPKTSVLNDHDGFHYTPTQCGGPQLCLVLEEEEAPARTTQRTPRHNNTHTCTEEEACTEKCAALTHTFSSRFPPQSPLRSHPPPKVPAAKQIQKRQRAVHKTGQKAMDATALDSTRLLWTGLLCCGKERQRAARVDSTLWNVDSDSLEPVRFKLMLGYASTTVRYSS